MTPIAQAMRALSAQLNHVEAVKLRRLAAMVERLEERLDEIAANGQADAQAPREGNVVDFRGRST